MLDIEKRKWRCSWLDLLRSMLAIFVVFVHAVPWAATLQGGQAVTSIAKLVSDQIGLFAQTGGETNPAVLAFIVLSGYCIHRSGVGGGIRQFAARRAFRILPVYLAATAFGAIVFLIASPLYPLVKEVSATDSISASCFLAKLTTVAALFPSLSQCAFEGNAPIRTVAAEIWLYSAYPVGLYLIRRFGEQTFWGLIAAVAGIGLACTIYTGNLFWWHNDSFAGFLLYWWIGAKALDKRFTPVLVLVFPFAFMVWVKLSGDHSVLAVEARQLSVALMVAATLPLIDRPWQSRVTETLGRAGYSIYAFHAPIVYSTMAFGLPWQAALMLAVVFGLISFYLIERPMDQMGRDYSSARAMKSLS
jgi:peptidoglycan/LPS O-acetylase OafA/YrhL